ncbi:MAG: tRNA (guanosine(37)-N1)-methyltransferase TrmD [Thiocapsa sp.]|jgi:tRNA (guanine37-N1)-methyltransferase|nr:tRNA (guanosine(37)-N1)-methyltransferase TrmD [Thiocapsa sp.]MCG6896804.1 tRNA (guanosine(37)-N1)-methyltransferase TrmD [Thiocapsa sp.]MCG6984579.1 tRNA (guanosine(37)-N1)-methyltransferase TrmD [Thiocapsa sp.]
MRFDVVTLLPELFRILLDQGVTGRALRHGIAELHLWNPRDYAHDRHRTVDDRPYGGGPGMVMKVEPLRDAIAAARAEAPGSRVAHLSPQGRLLDQAAVEEIATEPGWILVAGRYEGIDERLIERDIDQEWSIGDYVLSGGELPAMVLIDAAIRLLPGALGHPESAARDSHTDGLLDCPHYTRPLEVDGCAVPAVLIGGDHRAIERWRRQQALGRTWQRRPDLLVRRGLSPDEQTLLDEYIRLNLRDETG